MKAKLIKIDFQYFLNDSNDNLIATTENSPYKRLSMRNCQAIERGYDLDELAENYSKKADELANVYGGKIQGDNNSTPFKDGFKKALELLGDKKFSEEDMEGACCFGVIYERHNQESHKLSNDNEWKDFIQTLHPTEWHVEIEMRSKETDELRESNEGFLNNLNLYVPQLDEDDCLILKRV